MSNDRYTSASQQSRPAASGDQTMQNVNNMTELEKKSAARRMNQERTQSAKKRKPSKRKRRRWVYAFFAALSLEIQQAKEKSAEKKAQQTKSDAVPVGKRYETQQPEASTRIAEKQERQLQNLDAVQADGEFLHSPNAVQLTAEEEEFQNFLNSFLDAEEEHQPSSNPEQPTAEEEEFQNFLNSFLDAEEEHQPSSNPEQPAAEEEEFQNFLNSFLDAEEEHQPSSNPEQPAAEEEEFQSFLNSFLNAVDEPQPALSPEQSAAEEEAFQIFLNSLLAENEEDEDQPSSNPEETIAEAEEAQIIPAVMIAAEETEPEISSNPEPLATEVTEPQVSSNPEPPAAEEIPSQQPDEIPQTSSENDAFENETATAAAEQNKRKLDKKAWITAAVIFCSIMLVTLGYLGIRSMTAANDFRKLSQQISEKEAELSGSMPTEKIPSATGPSSDDEAGMQNDSEEAEPVVKTILPKYADLVAQNPELFGWVRIDDTVLDYPVMRSVTDNEKYLYANFEGKYSFAGTPFVDNQCTSDSDNLVIYGHNIKDGSMFRSLFKYENESYWKKHPTIMYSDLCEDYEYEVMAVFYDRIYKKTEDVFKFYQFIDAENEEAFNYAVQQLKSKSLYDTGVDAQYGDQLITLVTCSYQVENGRFVVVARRK